MAALIDSTSLNPLGMATRILLTCVPGTLTTARRSPAFTGISDGASAFDESVSTGIDGNAPHGPCATLAAGMLAETGKLSDCNAVASPAVDGPCATLAAGMLAETGKLSDCNAVASPAVEF